MTFKPGQTLLHYEFIESIGKGGMGVVWRARDTRLRREVALKLLAPGLVDQEHLKQRFLREARAAAAISHPHIATVFEVGETDGVSYIAMELVRGDTLRARIEGGPQPIADTLDITCEVADGLAHAHRSGVIHRDLKPENVMIGDDNHARILDFGLAKLIEPDQPEGDPNEAKTITERLTRLGKVMGTAAYMSPEQARGQKVDARTDIFSFGALLYELITGQVPFRGATPLDTLTAVINEEPRPPSVFNDRVPPELERIVRKCLQKKPDQRYQDTSDLLVDLRQLKRETDSQPIPMPATETNPWRQPKVRRTALAGALLAVVLYGAYQMWGGRTEPAPALPVIDQRLLTNNTPDNPVGAANISRDGRYLAYTEGDKLLVKVLDTGEIKDLTPLIGEDGGYPAGWFPDGTRLAFIADPWSDNSSLRSISIVTGTVQTIRDDASGFFMGCGVSPDGRTIAFMAGEDDFQSIWLMDADGSRPRKVINFEEGDNSLSFWVRWSPDSQRILYRRQVIREDGHKNAIETCDLEGGSRTIVLPPLLHIYPGIHAIWSPDNRIVFARTESSERPRDNNLWAIDIDPHSGEPRSEPRRLTSWYGFFSTWMTSTTAGDISLVRWRTQTEIGIASLDRQAGTLGAGEPLTLDAMDDVFGAWLPDSRNILFYSNRRGNHDIYRADVTTGRTTPLVTSPIEDVVHAITPDGEWLLMATRKDAAHIPSLSPWTLHRVALAGGSPIEIGTMGAGDLLNCGRGPGSRCVVSRITDNGVQFFELDPMTGDEALLADANLPAAEWDIFTPWSLSPDGHTIVWKDSENEDANRILTMDLNTAERHAIDLPDSVSFGWVSWDSDGDALLAVALPEREMMRIGLDGSIERFASQGRHPVRIRDPLVSPDGNRIAYQTNETERAVWLVSGY